MDDWFYLRGREHPETIPYLEAENRYTEEAMRPYKDLEKRLYEEMVGRVQETDSSAPYRAGEFEYYSRTERGLQYPILCRRPAAGGAEEILLDCNELARGAEYFAIAFDRVSPDGRTLAYAVNTDGSEVYTLRFRDLATGAIAADEIVGVYYAAAWADERNFLYTTLDAAKRPYRLWRHELGSAEPDALLIEEPDERFNVEIERARSGKFLFATIHSHTTSEVWVSGAGARPEFRLLRERRQDVEYFAEHQGDWFYIRANDEGRNFRLARVPSGNPAAAWETVLGHREEATLEGVAGFENHLVLMERVDGLPRIRVWDMRDGGTHFVAFDEPAYTVAEDRNAEYETAKFRFVYSSLVTPRSVYDYDMETRGRELKKRVAVLGGYNPDHYLTERIFATAPDGVRVPISLVRRRDTGPGAPAYLYGYGSYGILTEPWFSSERVSLLDRGFVFAIAHIRGSGDLGRTWYEAGKLLRKKNTFHDFVACAEKLIEAGYTTPDRLAIAGGSAGGLLMGAVTNMRPDLFRAVVAHVPFVDVVNTMLDPTLPLTVTEYEEWGNPEREEFYLYIRSYAPYENVEARRYPDILATAGLNDPRVPYWEPAKWVAKVRDRALDPGLVLLKTNLAAGHGGPSGRYEKLAEKAFEYCFILRGLGVAVPRGLARVDLQDSDLLA